MIPVANHFPLTSKNRKSPSTLLVGVRTVGLGLLGGAVLGCVAWLLCAML